jgi:hypothetical protein
MRTSAITAVALALVATCGCQSVHSSRADGVPVAMWSSIIFTDQEGREQGGPQIQEKVLRVLRDRGLDATVDRGGVSVPENEERRAREVLLTDKRLAGSDLIVLLAVPAGSGRQTAAGFEIPELVPRDRDKAPSTAPSK